MVVEAIIILVSSTGGGRFRAIVEARQIMASSRAPFLAGCRVLPAEGMAADAVAVMRHMGSDTDCLKGKVGTAAGLMVAEDHSGIRFRKFTPISRKAPPSIRQNGAGASDDRPAEINESLTPPAGAGI